MKVPSPKTRRKTYNGVTLWPIGDLIPYGANARTHSPEQIARLAAAIDAFGLAGLIIVRDGVIAKGHGTLAACRDLIARGNDIYPVPGRTGGAAPYPLGFLPVQDATGWTDQSFRAFVLADNQVALQSGWDEDLLHAELAALAAEVPALVDIAGFDLEAIDAELHAHLALLPLTRPARPAPDVDMDDADDTPEHDPSGADAAAPAGPSERSGAVYQIIVGMDQPTKRRYLKLKRGFPSADALFREALDHLEAAHTDRDTADRSK